MDQQSERLAEFRRRLRERIEQAREEIDASEEQNARLAARTLLAQDVKLLRDASETLRAALEAEDDVTVCGILSALEAHMQADLTGYTAYLCVYEPKKAVKMAEVIEGIRRDEKGEQ